jgi:hypothetical protein
MRAICALANLVVIIIIICDRLSVYEEHGSQFSLRFQMMTASLTIANLLHRRTILLRSHHRSIAPRSRCVVERLDVCAPLVCIRPQNSAVVG